MAQRPLTEELGLFHTTFEGTVNSPWQELTFRIEGDDSNTLKRWLGCAIMAHMPEDALDVTLETLKDIFVFNLENAQLTLPQSISRYSNSRFVSKAERPEFTLVDE